PLLASHFRLKFAGEHGLEAPEIGPETMRRLLSHDWPGNVRELENFIERSIIMHAGARTIPFDAPSRPGGKGQSETEMVGKAAHARWSLARLEREYILEVLQANHGHQIRTAEILGIDRRTLYRKLKQYREEGTWAGMDEVAVAG